MQNNINKKGQVTIFIIIAVVLVGGLIAFFVYRSNLFQSGIPSSVSPAYDKFLSCLESSTTSGIDVLESQGGYIETPKFEPGSSYMPFSSQLDFLGNPIPYWYYVSGNNIQKEQVPTKSSMEVQLAHFIDNKIQNCVYNSYYDQGFIIKQGNPKSSVIINDGTVDVNLDMPLTIQKENDSAQINSHKIYVKSNLGSLYNNAKKVYDYEQSTLFLENYSIDTLRLYAPVDGVELSCSPKIWKANEVFNTLKDSIEANTLALRGKKNNYKLLNQDNKYFLVDLPTDNSVEVRFLNSKNWTYSYDVNPSEESLLISNPVGNQQGLGILGFCYVPYHFVYDIKYPVLVQVSKGDEIFQFPMAVVIQGNNPRQSLDVSAYDFDLPQLCTYKNTDVSVHVYDTKLNSIEADVSYECFGTQCDIGKTNGGTLNEKFPQCANGYVIAKAQGYETKKQILSTIESGTTDVILDKSYNLNVDLSLDNSEYNGSAVISFSSDKDSKTILYPYQNKVDLSEGQYEISVYIYKNSEIKVGATVQEQCVEVPQGVLGSLGITKKRCFNVQIPEQIISNALAGGGKQNYYILESELENSKTVKISSQSLPNPSSLDSLQQNYILYDKRGLDVSFN